MANANQVKIGKVVQCIGAVVDVEFPRDQMPKVFEALIIDDASSQAEVGLTLEAVSYTHLDVYKRQLL